MKSLGRPLLGIALTVSLVLRLAGVSAAQIVFDPAVYQALADVDSAATIPAGTKITTANWQQYKQFMTVWIKRPIRVNITGTSKRENRNTQSKSRRPLTIRCLRSLWQTPPS